MYHSLPLNTRRLGGICDLLLVNRTWQRWWGATPWLCYIIRDSVLADSASGLEDIRSHAVREPAQGPTAKDSGRGAVVGTESGLCMPASKQMGPESQSCKGMNAADNQVR